MLFKRLFIYFTFLVTAFALISCSRSREEVWDDTSSCYRHVTRGFRSLCGTPCDSSRQIRSRQEFYCPEDDCCTTFYLESQDVVQPYENDSCNEIAMADFISPPPKDSPGDPDSPIPGIEAFKDPSKDRSLRGIFKNIGFPYNSNLIKGSENLNTIQSIANYMRSHPRTYIFVEGHCDERGPAAYNFALGSKRANSVRNMLIESGVNSDNIFTISYGKERPIDTRQSEDGWEINRRAEFKIYDR